MTCLTNVSATVLSASADGVAPAMLLSITDNKSRTLGQYLFNAPEGITRLMLEHRCRPNLHFKALFLSGGSAAESGGLGGLLLRLKQDGHGAMQLVGPAGSSSSLSGLKPFISWKHPQVYVTEPQQQQQQQQQQHTSTAAAVVTGGSSNSSVVAVSYADRHIQVVGFAAQPDDSSSRSSTWQPPAWLLPTAAVVAAEYSAPAAAAADNVLAAAADGLTKNSSSSSSSSSDTSSSSSSGSFKSAGVSSSASDSEQQGAAGGKLVSNSSSAELHSKQGNNRSSSSSSSSSEETSSSAESDSSSSDSSSSEQESSSSDVSSSSDAAADDDHDPCSDNSSSGNSSSSSSSIGEKDDTSEHQQPKPQITAAAAAGGSSKKRELFNTLDSIFMAAAPRAAAAAARGRSSRQFKLFTTPPSAAAAAGGRGAAAAAGVRASALAALSGKAADGPVVGLPAAAAAAAAAAAGKPSCGMPPESGATAAAAKTNMEAATTGKVRKKRKQHQQPDAAPQHTNKQQQLCHATLGSIDAHKKQKVDAKCQLPVRSSYCCQDQPDVAAAAAPTQQQQQQQGGLPQQLLGYICHILPLSSKPLLHPYSTAAAGSAATTAAAAAAAAPVGSNAEAAAAAVEQHQQQAVGQLMAVLFCRNQQQLLQLQHHPAVIALCNCSSSSGTSGGGGGDDKIAGSSNDKAGASSSSRVLAVFHVTSAAVAAQPDYQAWMQSLPGQQVLMPHQQVLITAGGAASHGLDSGKQQQQQGHGLAKAVRSATADNGASNCTTVEPSSEMCAPDKDTNHDIPSSSSSSTGDMCMGFRASARVLSRLNLVSPAMFPLPYLLKEQNGLSDEEAAAAIQQAERQQQEKEQQQQQQQQQQGVPEAAAATQQEGQQQQGKQQQQQDNKQQGNSKQHDQAENSQQQQHKLFTTSEEDKQPRSQCNGQEDIQAKDLQLAQQQQQPGTCADIEQQQQQPQLDTTADMQQQQQQQATPQIIHGKLLLQILWRGLQYCPPLTPPNNQPQWDWAQWQWQQWDKQQQQQQQPLSVRDLQLELLLQRPKLQQLLPIARRNWPGLTKQQQQQQVRGYRGIGGSSSCANKSAAQALREKLLQRKAVQSKHEVDVSDGAASPGIQAAAAAAAEAVAEGSCNPYADDADDESAPAMLSQPWAADTAVVFLGTGSAEPSKYRGPSAILLRVSPGSSSSSTTCTAAASTTAAAAAAWVLMDAGEGTLGAIQRLMGPDAAAAVIDSLACIWISHKHADHMLGVPALLEAKSRRSNLNLGSTNGTCGTVAGSTNGTAAGSTNGTGGVAAGSTNITGNTACMHEPVLLVGPRELLSWLQQLPGHHNWQYTFVPLAEFSGGQQQQQQAVVRGLTPPKPPPLPSLQQQQQQQQEQDNHQQQQHQQQQQQQFAATTQTATSQPGWQQQQQFMGQQQQQFMVQQQQQHVLMQQQQLAILQQAQYMQTYSPMACINPNLPMMMHNPNMTMQNLTYFGCGPMQMGQLNPSMVMQQNPNMMMMQHPDMMMQQQQWGMGSAPMHLQTYMPIEQQRQIVMQAHHTWNSTHHCWDMPPQQQQQQRYINQLPGHINSSNMPVTQCLPNTSHVAAVQQTSKQQQQQRGLAAAAAAARVMSEGLGFTGWISVPVAHCAGAHGLVLTHSQGWKLVYSGDTRPCAALAAAGAGATLLIHEATFECGLSHHARAKGHSTMQEALEAANNMQAYRTVLTHFSQRYPRLPAGYPHTAHPWRQRPLLAVDGAVVTFSLLPQLPALMPAVAAALEELEEDEAVE